MIRISVSVCAWCALTASGILALQAGDTVDPHAYFNALTARADLFKSYALRSQAEIDRYSQTSPNTWVTYDPVAEAAKAVIPSFNYEFILATAASAGDDRLVLRYVNRALLTRGRAIKVDDEIMTIVVPDGASNPFPTENSVSVLRGQYRTSAAAHDAGSLAQISDNSLRNQVRVPIGSSVGHSYFITWDALFTESYLNHSLDSHKAYQLADGSLGRPGIWLETRTRYTGLDAMGRYPGYDKTRHVAVVDGRSYNTDLPGAPGSNMTSVQPLTPQVGRFLVWPSRWIRFTWYIEQRPREHDLATLWVSDEGTDPVKIFDAITVNAGGNPATIAMWYLELNSSQEPFRHKDQPLVSYVRNLVVLQDVEEPDRLLQRPLSNGVLPPAPPRAPRNLRIIR